MKYIFWLKAAAIFQLFTAGLHSISLVIRPRPVNDTERQLLDLMHDYKLDLGAGFMHSMKDLMNAFSIAFTLLLLFGGLLNWYLLKKKVETEIMTGVIGINCIIFGGCFLTMTFLTFLPPIICTGLIFLCLLMAYVRIPKQQQSG